MDVEAGRQTVLVGALDSHPPTELWISAHPSYLLRLHDFDRATEEKRFAADLRKVAGRLAELAE